MTDHPTDPPHTPRSEPEIIPPRGHKDSPWVRGKVWPDASGEGFADGPNAPNGGVFITIDEQGRTHYRSFTPPGPFTIGIVLAVLGLIGAAALLFAFGLVLFLIPIAAIAVAGLVLSSRVSSWWRRLTRS